MEKVRPDECYHLADQSFVNYSFEYEFSTINTNINRTQYILSALKRGRHLNVASFLQPQARCLEKANRHCRMKTLLFMPEKAPQASFVELPPLNQRMASAEFSLNLENKQTYMQRQVEYVRCHHERKLRN